MPGNVISPHLPVECRDPDLKDFGRSRAVAIRVLEGLDDGLLFVGGQRCVPASLRSRVCGLVLVGLKDGDEHQIYSDFRDAVEKARAEAEAQKLKAIHIAATDGTWQAAAWWLERSFPDRWGRRERIEVDTTAKVEIVHVDQSAERIGLVLETLADIDALPNADAPANDG